MGPGKHPSAQSLRDADTRHGAWPGPHRSDEGSGHGGNSGSDGMEGGSRKPGVKLPIEQGLSEDGDVSKW